MTKTTEDIIPDRLNAIDKLVSVIREEKKSLKIHQDQLLALESLLEGMLCILSMRDCNFYKDPEKGESK